MADTYSTCYSECGTVPRVGERGNWHRMFVTAARRMPEKREKNKIYEIPCDKHKRIRCVHRKRAGARTRTSGNVPNIFSMYHLSARFSNLFYARDAGELNESHE